MTTTQRRGAASSCATAAGQQVMNIIGLTVAIHAGLTGPTFIRCLAWLWIAVVVLAYGVTIIGLSTAANTGHLTIKSTKDINE